MVGMQHTISWSMVFENKRGFDIPRKVKSPFAVMGFWTAWAVGPLRQF